MIQQQLSPQPSLFLKNPPPHPPQHARRMMIQIQDIPLLLSHPHPQFVAVKSLISFSSEIIIYNVSYAWGH